MVMMTTNSGVVIFLCFMAIVSMFGGANCGFDDGTSSTSDKSYKVVCYYTNWAQYRPDVGKFLPENINPHLCTHIIYAFAKINDKSELEAFEWNDESTDWMAGMYNRTVQLKKKNPSLKVTLAVGGWNLNSMPFSNMAADDFKRANFVAKAVEFLKKNKFDGLDLDWEYPASRDTEDRPEDKIHFTSLCKDLYTAFKPHGMILSAAVAAGNKYIKSAYELAEIHKYLDFINLMAYDLHGGWENVTGHNAPLYIHEFDKDATLNVHFAVKAWLEYVPSDKLVLGVPAYGRSFKIKEGFSTCPLVDTPVSGPGTAGRYTREDGFLSEYALYLCKAYYEVCEKLAKSKWRYVWSEQQKIPYAFSNDTKSEMEWVGFDDVRSIEYKAKYIKENNLAGGMFWSLDQDDFTGTYCNQGQFPLLSTLSFHLNSNAKAVLPKAEAVWQLDRKPTMASMSGSSSSDSVMLPPSESDFIERNNDTAQQSRSQAGFFSSNNIFGLIQNDVLQIYKFCQCKNGTHKIYSNNAVSVQSVQNLQDNSYSFKVDCNRKRFFSSASKADDVEDNTAATTSSRMPSTRKPLNPDQDTATKDGKANENSVENNNSNSNIWSIFDDGKSQTKSGQMLVCYLNALSLDKATRKNNFNLNVIDPFLCSHIIISIAKISPSTDELALANDFDFDGLRKINSLKSFNPNLRVMLSVGSFVHGTSAFRPLWAHSYRRRRFIRNVILLLNKLGLDGLEITWNQRDADTIAMPNFSVEMRKNKIDFTKFCQEFKLAFTPFNLLLSASVSGLVNVAEYSYEINKLHKYLDFVTIMTHDFYENPLKLIKFRHYAPLFGSTSRQSEVFDTTSQNVSVSYWISRGFPREKLLLGAGLYGRSYKLVSNTEDVIGKYVVKEGAPGDFTHMPGILSYYEICDNLFNKNWLYRWLSDEMVPIAYSQDDDNEDDEAVCYDDTDSLAAKATYAKSSGLAGMSLWSMELDDFSGLHCMQGALPLVRTVREILQDDF